MALISYGLAHINRSFELIHLTGEPDFEENSKKAVTLLKTAAGIFEYVSTSEISRWLDIPSDRPIELNGTILSALSDYACCCAQTLTIKKGLISGTSPSALSKLAVDCWKKSESLAALFKKSEFSKDLLASWKSFVGLMDGIYKGEAFKYMSQGAYANGEYGNSVGFINVAVASVKSVWIPSKGAHLDKYSDELEFGKLDIEHTGRKFNNENNHIYIQKIPQESALSIAEPKSMMTPQQWLPPTPSFKSLV